MYDYIAPQTVPEAAAALSDTVLTARPLAGGTDLLVQMRHGTNRADVLVDLKRIPELTVGPHEANDGLRFGAAVACSDLAADRIIGDRYHALADATALIGGTAIRNRATVGGNLCNAAPSADTAPALIVLGASCLVSGPEGERWIAAEEFVTGPGRCALRHGELMTAISIPAPGPKSGSAYLRFIPRGEMDIAVAGAAASATLSDDRSTIVAARVALAAVAPVPLVVPAAAAILVGSPPTTDVLATACARAMEAAAPIDDVRGSAAFRRHIVGVLTRRALETALGRAREEVRTDG